LVKADGEERAVARCRFAVQGAHSSRPSASSVVAENRAESTVNDSCTRVRERWQGVIASGQVTAAEVVDAIDRAVAVGGSRICGRRVWIDKNPRRGLESRALADWGQQFA
jgi:hypothetical protein